MGNLLDRRRDDEVEEESIDRSSTLHRHHGYLYPPQTGFYFGSHFFMGGEKFETGSPQTYLFGDNSDLNFLGPKLMSFPYLAPVPDEPTRSLRALVNIRKETLRFIKIPSPTCTTNTTITHPDLTSDSLSTNSTPANQIHTNLNDSSNASNSNKRLSNDKWMESFSAEYHELKEYPSSSISTAALPTTSSSPLESSKLDPTSSSSSSSLDISLACPSYNIEFTFDSDVKCSVTIYYLAIEESTPSGNIYVPRDPTYKTETYHYPMGAGQVFSHPSLIFNPNSFSEDDLAYRAFDEYGNFDPTIPYPIVIQLNAEEGTEPRQSHSLIATCERNNEKQFYIKPFKQKIVIDGLSYLIQEVYGIENKNPVYSTSSNDKPAFYSSDEEIEDNGSECVICMSESRDTLILPCRHLCLCNACADSLRYQANNCPICRSPFRALLQFRAVRKIISNNTHLSNNTKAIVTTQSSSLSEPPNTSSSSSTTPASTTASSSNKHIKHRSARSVLSIRPSTSINTNVSNTIPSGSNGTKVDPPSGYEFVSLIEALNGPSVSSNRPDGTDPEVQNGLVDEEPLSSSIES